MKAVISAAATRSSLTPIGFPGRSALSLLAHGGLIAVLWAMGGIEMAFFAVLLPMTVAATLGSYLFFAQHSFKRMQVLSPESWTFYRAAMQSSSYMRLNRVMQWFTGNIGYHHIHHLNVRIPFYRLPEAMAAVPGLQSPITTSLTPREIVNCFRSRTPLGRVQTRPRVGSPGFRSASSRPCREAALGSRGTIYFCKISNLLFRWSKPEPLATIVTTLLPSTWFRWLGERGDEELGNPWIVYHPPPFSHH